MYQAFQAIPVFTLEVDLKRYDFGCRTRSTVSLTVPEWESVSGWFREPAATPRRSVTRSAARWAVKFLMEVVIGRHTPTHLDLAADEIPGKQREISGQQDCIDESVNKPC